MGKVSLLVLTSVAILLSGCVVVRKGDVTTNRAENCVEGSGTEIRDVGIDQNCNRYIKYTCNDGSRFIWTRSGGVSNGEFRLHGPSAVGATQVAHSNGSSQGSYDLLPPGKLKTHSVWTSQIRKGQNTPVTGPKFDVVGNAVTWRLTNLDTKQTLTCVRGGRVVSEAMWSLYGDQRARARTR